MHNSKASCSPHFKQWRTKPKSTPNKDFAPPPLVLLAALAETSKCCETFTSMAVS